MSRPLLADDTKPTPRRRTGRFRVLIWLLVVFMLLTLSVLFTLITTQPGSLGLARIADLQQTESAIQATVSALQATSDQQQQRDQALQNTQAALSNFEARLAQTETQQAVNQVSTGAAAALVNEQQATQAAVNYQNTQSALQLVSTQAQRDFEATQTAISGGFATNAAQRPPEHITILDGDFVRGSEAVNAGLPLISSAWALTDSGALVGQRNAATLLTKRNDFGANYTANVWLTTLTTSAYYDVLFGASQAGGGYVLRVYHDGTQLNRAD
ncbi:MAG: hypothetical protein H7Y11_09955, partial [Armatimonadetes bacterium]|nr:hypothetical protein [Anaerolineae bacterium]